VSSSFPLLRDDQSIVVHGLSQELDSAVIMAFDSDGNLLWEHVPGYALSGPPTIANNEGLLAFCGHTGQFDYVDALGAPLAGPVLALLSNPGTPLSTGDRLVIAALNNRVHALDPPAANLTFYDTSEQKSSELCYDAASNSVFVVTIDNLGDLARITALSPSSVFNWSYEIETPCCANVTVDRDGDLLVSVFDFNGDNDPGVFCVGQDQVVNWFHDTAGAFPGTPIPIADGKVVLIATDLSLQTSELIAIGI
jgi:hypothetical protein